MMMAHKDYSPLTNACVRALTDKLYDKRKAAALEIEKMVRELSIVHQSTQIRKLLQILGEDLSQSHNPNTRKGGLIGLAAMSIALGKESTPYIDGLIKPMISSLSDQDSRVRYYACEALYNVIKVARGDVLHLFNDIFDALSKLAADPDQNVKNGAELLDRLMKDIVTESSSFDLVAFIPLLRERIYSRSPFTRQFIVSWISVLCNVPDIDMIVFLPEILDGLYNILGDPTLEIRRMCETALAEFLYKIIRNGSKADFAAMVNILIIHSQSSEEIVQFTAITWLKEFINLVGSSSLLPYVSGILTAILPCLAQSPSKIAPTFEDGSENKPNTLFASNRNVSSNIRQVAETLNYSLMHLVTMEHHQKDEVINQMANSVNNDRNFEPNKLSESVSKSVAIFDLLSVIEVLTQELRKGENASKATKLTVLCWIHHLYAKVPQKIIPHLEEIFPQLLKTLSDPSDEVVLMDLEVLAQIFSSGPPRESSSSQLIRNHHSSSMSSLKLSSSNNETLLPSSCFTKFIIDLLKLFNKNTRLLDERGSFIIRQLCLLLNSEDIYRSFSEILLNYDDLNFAYIMVQTLNLILLTSSELYELRAQLRDLKTDESCSLFCSLYRTWCHSPIATVALCLLTKNYKHACDILMMFGELDITLQVLTEIDQLVQLLESPLFAYLRLQLLDVERNGDLVKCLYGLLMLLPQGEAFLALSNRLQCVPNFKLSDPSSLNKDATANSPSQPKMDFKDLLRHFHDVQEKHKNWRYMKAVQKVRSVR